MSFATVRRAEAKRTLIRWREQPALFVRECFGINPDRWQRKALRAFATDQRLAMKACKGPGKTTCLAWMILNFMATRPDCNVACTSITGDNLSDGLWKELAKWMHKSPYLQEAFEWQKTRIVSRVPGHAATWWCSARTWPKDADSSQQADALAGLHADYMLFVIDEAGGVPLPVLATAEAALAGGIETKICIAGNPTHTEGPLWMASTQFAHLWTLFEVTADPDDPDRTPRVSKEWAQQQIDMFGRDNPWVLVNVFGKFPPASINALLGPDEVRESQRRTMDKSEYQHWQKRIGIDVARFGDDRTVLAPRQGLVAFPFVEMRGERTTQIAARVMLAKDRWGSELEIIDDTGHWGHGVIDNLLAAGHTPVGVQFHAKAIDKRYKNRRVEGWLRMAEWVRRGGILPQHPDLMGELTTPTYTFVNGVFHLEEKDQVKERLGRSPDLADALALTFMLPEAPSSQDLPLWLVKKKGTVAHEWDPYEFTGKRDYMNIGVD
jgi:hypothetical protein